MSSPRGLFPLLLVVSAALLAYSSIRAERLSFVHDESLSYRLATGDPAWKNTANDHPLNTALMAWALRGLGAREWQLRLPNVLAHVLYLACGLALLRRLAHGTSALLGFSLLNLNPFLLDFFGLARGYGLALGLSMAALLLLWLAWGTAALAGRATLVLASSGCAWLADLANYTWLNLHLPILGAGVLVVLFPPGPLRPRVAPRALAAAAAIAAANAWAVHGIARRVLALQKVGELYGRGTRGFVSDTVGSLVESWFYRQPHGTPAKWILTGILIAGFGAAALAMLRQAWRLRRITFPALLALVFALAVAAPIAEHLLLGVEYPNERIALYYVPAGGLLAAFAADEVLRGERRAPRSTVRAAALAVVAGMALHLARTANLRHTRTWFYDASTKAAMLEIGKRFGAAPPPRALSMGNGWMFEPTINFYRTTLGYDWLSPATRDRLGRDDNDVVYCFAADLGDGAPRYRVLRAYPDTGTVLYVRE